MLHDNSEAINLHSNQFGDRNHLISFPRHIFNLDGKVHQVAAFCATALGEGVSAGALKIKF